jgi:hypothetical protein
MSEPFSTVSQEVASFMADSQEASIVLASSGKADAARDLIVAEYNNLHAELLKRLDIRYQTIQFALTALGVFLTIGFSVKVAVLIYTFTALVLVLSITYVTNSVDSHRIRRYVASHIEPRVQHESNEEPFGWRYHREKGRHLSIGKFRLGTLGDIGAKLLLLFSSVIAVVTGKLATQLYGGDNATFFSLACIAVVLEGILLFGGESYLSHFYEK